MRLVLLILLSLASLCADAQTAEPVAPDSAQVDSTFHYGWSRTYRDILSETVLLRLTNEAQESLALTSDPSLGIVGLLVDETLTPSGRLFYESFYLYWKPPPGAESKSLTVGELPLPGNGTAITIRSDGEAIVQARLPRRSEEIEGLAQQAVAYIQQLLQ